MTDDDYGSVSFWDARYRSLAALAATQPMSSSSSSSGSVDCYDWYLGFEDLKPFLLPYLKSKQMEILYPGCGNSSLGYDLYNLGYHNVSNVDFSSAVIEQMCKRNLLGSGRAKGMYDMDYAVMDARRLESLPDQCFDLVLDKGLLDSLLCADTNYDDVGLYVNEMRRVLAPGGCFLVVSHSPPSSRLGHLQGSDWAVDHVSLPRPHHAPTAAGAGAGSAAGAETTNSSSSTTYYMYTCRKGTSS